MSSTLAARLAAVPGVTAAIGDVSVPARLGSHMTEAHGWASAALTPYVLSAGRPPAGPGEVVTGYRAALGTRLLLASTGPARTVTVVGVALPATSRRPSSAAIFLTDTEAARLAGHPGRVDAIGVLATPGFDVSRLRAAAGTRGSADRGRARLGRASRAPADADHLDPRHGSVWRTGDVHRDVRRSQHDGPVDPAAPARDRSPASGGSDARSDPPHDRLGGDDRRPRGLGGGNLARDPPRPGARTRVGPPRHRPAHLRRQSRLDPGCGGHRWWCCHDAARRLGRRTPRGAGTADAAHSPTPRSSPGCSGPDG